MIALWLIVAILLALVGCGVYFGLTQSKNLAACVFEVEQSSVTNFLEVINWSPTSLIYRDSRLKERISLKLQVELKDARGGPIVHMKRHDVDDIGRRTLKEWKGKRAILTSWLNTSTFWSRDFSANLLGVIDVFLATYAKTILVT